MDVPAIIDEATRGTTSNVKALRKRFPMRLKILTQVIPKIVASGPANNPAITARMIAIKTLMRLLFFISKNPKKSVFVKNFSYSHRKFDLEHIL